VLGSVLGVALLAAGTGTGWAGTLPGGDDDNDDHHRDRRHCPSATSEPAQPADLIAGLGSILSPPDSPGPVPPLPTSGPVQIPDRDPFYRGPEGYEACAPGTILRSRIVTITGLPVLTNSSAAYQLLFRSTDAHGKAIAAVTTILKPRVPAPGAPKLLSYQTAEDSLTTGCAPSYTLRTGSGLSLPAESAYMPPVLAAGWIVNIPDHEGPRSEYGAGPLEGRVTLDSIRAVERFGPAGLDGVRTPVGMMGYSGGSTPTLWANALAPDYAPELNLVGSASGGVVADFNAILRAHAGPPFFAGYLGYPVALNRTYPDLDLDSLLTARGREIAERHRRDAGGCFILATGASAPLDSVRTLTRYPDIDSFLAVPQVARTLAKTNLVTGPRLHTPTLIVQGIQDEFLNVDQVDALVGAHCRRGAPIEYHRVPGEHVSTLVPYTARAIPFFQDRFAGRPAASNCT
jgi:triacylglycerol lipase